MANPDTFCAETRHGLVRIKVYPTDAEIQIWRGGCCHASFKCSINEMVSLAGLGAAAYNQRAPYMTEEDQNELNTPRKSFTLGSIMHASRPKDQRLIEKMKNTPPATTCH